MTVVSSVYGSLCILILSEVN